MDVKRLFAFIRRWLVVLVVSTVGAGAAGYLSTRLQEPTRETEAQLLVGPTSDRLDTLRAASSVAQTYVELASSTRVLEAAARRTDIAIEPAAFRKVLRVRANELTRILSIHVTGNDAQRAAALANALAAELVEMSKPPPTPTPAPTPVPTEGRRNEAPRATADTREGPSVLSLSLVEAATPSSADTAATPLVVVVLAAMLGLGASTLVAAIVEVLRDRVRDADEVVELTGSDCIAVPVGRRKGSLAERVRTASKATHLVAALPDAGAPTERARVVALCPAGNDQETADIALSLSATLGTAGQATVILDADPHRRLTRTLGLNESSTAAHLRSPSASDPPGSTHGDDQDAYATGTPATEPAASQLVRYPLELPGVWVVPGGFGFIPNSADATEVLQGLLKDADRVVLVTGSPTHDAASLEWTRAADVAVLVATAGQTKRSELAETAHSLRLAGTKVSGTVLRVMTQRLSALS